jgi:hypothetical protein
VYVNAELIAIVASAIALGTAMLASIRGVRQEVRDLRTEMKGDMNELRTELKGDMDELGTALKGDMNDLKGDMNVLGNESRGGLKVLESSLRDEMKSVESRLRDEMQAGFKELTARVVNIGDRLSKVEGVIEGMFWGARNQPADKPGEGAA